MPRPEYIAEVHAAKYDWYFAVIQEQPAMRRRYEAALQRASELAGCSVESLRAALGHDFRAWIREEKLPPPPQQQG